MSAPVTPASDAPQQRAAHEFIRHIESQSETLRAPIPGGQLAIRTWGNASHTPLVLLHGGFGSWRHWILNVTWLSTHYHVLCVDLPGLGDSDLLEGDYQPQRIASALDTALASVLGAETRFFLAGFSFGGIIGSHLAAHASRRVQGFVAVAPGALGLAGTIPVLESLNGKRDPENVRAIHRINLGRLMINDPKRIDALAIEVQLETVKLARARSGRIPFGRSAADALAQCTCPIGGLWGERDVIAVKHMQQRRAMFRSIAPHCPFRVVQGAGHWVMYESPQQFNPLLHTMLAQLGQG